MGDKIKVSISGFGVSSINQFNFDANSGALSFNGQQFAHLESITGGSFNIYVDILLTF